MREETGREKVLQGRYTLVTCRMCLQSSAGLLSYFPSVEMLPPPLFLTRQYIWQGGQRTGQGSSCHEQERVDGEKLWKVVAPWCELPVSPGQVEQIVPCSRSKGKPETAFMREGKRLEEKKGVESCCTPFIPLHVLAYHTPEEDSPGQPTGRLHQ